MFLFHALFQTVPPVFMHLYEEYLKCKCFPVSDGPLELVPVKCIIEKCIYIEVEGRKYIARFPTMLSLD